MRGFPIGSESGFSLVEIMVVVGILGLLAVGFVTTGDSFLGRSRAQTAVTEVSDLIRTTIMHARYRKSCARIIYTSTSNNNQVDWSLYEGSADCSSIVSVWDTGALQLPVGVNMSGISSSSPLVVSGSGALVPDTDRTIEIAETNGPLKKTLKVFAITGKVSLQ